MVDPALFLIVALSFAALLCGAGQHKLRHWQRFRYVLAAYNLLPEKLVLPILFLLGIAELALGGAWLLVGLGGTSSTLVAITTQSLLLTYGFAMGINLKRGREYIDCGCGFSSGSGGPSGLDGGQNISWLLVIRNLMLAVLSITVLLPVSDREIGLFDALSVIVALITLTIFYGAAHQLLSNSNSIASWRRSDA